MAEEADGLGVISSIATLCVAVGVLVVGVEPVAPGVLDVESPVGTHPESRAVMSVVNTR